MFQPEKFICPAYILEKFLKKIFLHCPDPRLNASSSGCSDDNSFFFSIPYPCRDIGGEPRRAGQQRIGQKSIEQSTLARSLDPFYPYHIAKIFQFFPVFLCLGKPDSSIWHKFLCPGFYLPVQF